MMPRRKKRGGGEKGNHTGMLRALAPSRSHLRPPTSPPPLMPQPSFLFFCLHLNKQERFASKLLRGFPPAKRRRRRRRRLRRRLATAATSSATARCAPTPNFLHDQARRSAIPDAFRLLFRIESPQQELAIFSLVRQASRKAYTKHDAAKHRPCHAAAARGHAPQALDRLAHAFADLGTAGVLARYHRV